MVALMLEKPKKKKTRASPVKPVSSSRHDASPSQPSKTKGKEKEGEHTTLENTGGEENREDELLQSSSEE